MRKTFEELNQEYVPNNGSTNFSNSTCRRRLLDKYVGEGKWSYVYEGRKVVAVEVLTDEPETEVVEDEIIEEVVAEPEVNEYTTVKAVDEEIKRCEAEIERLNTRIKDLKARRLAVGKVSEVFKSVSFRKYACLGAITNEYDKALKLYEANRNKQGIDSEFRKVQVKYMETLVKHINHHDYWYRREFDKVHPNSKQQTEYYESIYSNNKNNCLRFRQPEEYRYKFVIDNEHYVNLSAIPVFEAVVKDIKAILDFDSYSYIKDTLKMLIKYRDALNEFNRKGELLFEQFCKGYNDFVERKQAEERNRRYKRTNSSFDDSFWEEFERAFGGGYSGRTSSSSSSSTFKYFTGTYASAKDVKSAYRTFAKSLHPDHGGDEAEFKAMYAEYERMMKRFVA